MSFDFAYDDRGVTLSVHQHSGGFLKRLLARPVTLDIDRLSAQDRNLLFALADLRSAAESHADGLEIDAQRIRMSHDVVADLDSQTAATLGLPPLVDLIFQTDVEGVPGQAQFRLRHQWLRLGEKQVVRRIGSILKTSAGERRLPRWLLDAVRLAEGFEPGSDLHAHWEALARFRQALEPGFHQGTATASAHLEMTDFLRGLHVQLADSFSLQPTGSDDDPNFDVIPFSRKTLEDEDVGEDSGAVVAAMAELAGQPLQAFQARVRDRGALSAYRVGGGRYLVIDRAAAPALRVMAEMQHAPPQERRAFIQNPRQKITAAIEQDLRERGLLENLTAAQQEELVEQAAVPAFVETKEYSARVTGKTIYTGSPIVIEEGSGTTWLPEVFGETIAQMIRALPVAELEHIEEKIQQAISRNEQSVEYDGEHIAATPTTERAIRRQIQTLVAETGTGPDDPPEPPEPPEEPAPKGRVILDPKNNLEQVQWQAKVKPRQALVPVVVPVNVETPLKDHQVESFHWQVEAWAAGLPGVLNADEQGLGKTLQTIAFLAWLKAQMAAEGAQEKGPILVVAPTSLLENWEQEVDRHLASGGLGHLVRLYGSGIATYRRRGANGPDTLDGEEHLDLGFLREAVAKGRGHQYWVLTTYTTLTNYQHSLGSIRFSALVFDEIQALKNPGSLRALAGMAMHADFRIGLTGTPIENSTTDLWAILEQLEPGRILPLSEFRQRFNTPNEEDLQSLYRVVFEPNEALPPMAMRRLKEDVARDLPAKDRVLYPRLMPDRQAAAYEMAREKLASGTRGAALKMLHHIRSVSVHPAVTANDEPEAFISLSGRLTACFEILDAIRVRDERVLVFIEHIQMQYRFIELLKARYGLRHVDLINGSTPIHKRQDIVNRFQQHLEHDQGFDVLVLGPKAAGTGLTLTAATHVVHLSRWWNPAVEEQCNDRVHRIGQIHPVTIHIPMAIHGEFREHSFDCLLHSLMTRKRKLASSALWPMGDTGDDAEQLQKMLEEEAGSSATGDPVESAILNTFERDGSPLPEPSPNGGFRYA
ncbi:MAG: DEAD/DEAH box helicase [Alphaproteobacteria bacterium]|nr:DEAD/DEAH box helicase [Alphaproteobacteria bacterium]MCB9931730.1 DEAD/DEAH box helicase [Alphaproteobacteria bacterium]